VALKRARKLFQRGMDNAKVGVSFALLGAVPDLTREC
jgi:hypothetical protein